MTNVFLTYIGISAAVGAAVLTIMLASPFINRRYAAKWKYIIWIFLAIRLLIPINGIYHKESPDSAVIERTPSQTQDIALIKTDGETVYHYQPQRFVVEIPVQAVENIVTAPQKARKSVSLLDIAVVIWLAGAAVFAAVHIFSYIHCKRKILRLGEKIDRGCAFELMQSIKAELNIKSKVALIRYPEAASPMVIGFIKPVLVLTGDDFDNDELYFIIRHELIHQKRRDVFAKLLIVAANAVHWFNPIIWLLRKETAIDMELSCDDGVVNGADFDIKKAYTETLMSALQRQTPKRSALTTQFYGGKSTMKKRFKNILSRRKKKNGVVILVCTVIITMLLGTLVGCTQRAPMPSDDELGQMIYDYLDFEAYSTHDNPPVDFDNPISDDPDDRWHSVFPVIKEGMTTWQEWLDYLGGIFTEKGVKSALEMTEGRYLEHDGKLCYSDGGMGWTLSRLFSIARVEQTSDKAFAVEFWREYDPEFCEGDGREFEITTLNFEYTQNGWRIADFGNRDSTPDDSHPNLNEFKPFGDPADLPDENVEPLDDVQGENIDDEVDQRIDEYVPDGYVPNELDTPVGQFGEGGTIYYYGNEQPAAVNFCLPKDWVFDKGSVANCNGTKVFEIGGVFPTEEFRVEELILVDHTETLPALVKGAEHDVTVYEEEVSDQGLYDYKCHSSVVLSTGVYETYFYIVSRNGYSVNVSFVVNEYYDEEICQKVLNSVWIRIGEEVDQRIDEYLRSEQLSDEAITALINMDLQISKFLYAEAPASDYQDSAEYNGREYYRVTDENFDTWDEWETYIRSAYFGQLAEDALATDTVVNIDGKTYSDGGSRGYELNGSYTYERAYDNGEKVEMHAFFETIEPNVTVDEFYTFAFQGGRWVIVGKGESELNLD